MVHEPPGVFRTNGIDSLFKTQRTHRHDGQHLGLASGEQSRAVGAGQDAGVAGYRADLVHRPSVRADVLLQDAASDGPSKHGFETVADCVLGVVIFQRFGDQCGDLMLAVVHLIHAGVLAEKVFPAGTDDIFYLGNERVGGVIVVFDYGFGLAHLGC